MTRRSAGYGMPAPFIADSMPPRVPAALLARVHDRLGASPEPRSPAGLADDLDGPESDVRRALAWLEREGLAVCVDRRWAVRTRPSVPEEHQKGGGGPPGRAGKGAPVGPPPSVPAGPPHLTPALAGTLEAIGAGAVNYRQLQDATGRSRSSVSGSVHRLRALGLVEPGMPLRAVGSHADASKTSPAEHPRLAGKPDVSTDECESASEKSGRVVSTVSVAPPASARSTSTTTTTSAPEAPHTTPARPPDRAPTPPLVSPWTELEVTARELETELPGWRVWPDVLRGWAARSPVHHLDGVVVVAPDPPELIERVRAHERLWARVMGRDGSTRARHEPTARTSSPPPASRPTFVGQGEPCGRCGGFLLRTGSCETCQSCGTTTGCG